MAETVEDGAGKARVGKAKAPGPEERPNYVRDVNIVRARMRPCSYFCDGFPRCTCGRADAEAALNNLYALALDFHTERSAVQRGATPASGSESSAGGLPERKPE